MEGIFKENIQEASDFTVTFILLLLLQSVFLYKCSCHTFRGLIVHILMPQYIIHGNFSLHSSVCVPLHVNVCLSTKVSVGGGLVMDACIMHQQYISSCPEPMM